MRILLILLSLLCFCGCAGAKYQTHLSTAYTTSTNDLIVTSTVVIHD